jgi:hypothetical protein
VLRCATLPHEHQVRVEKSELFLVHHESVAYLGKLLHSERIVGPGANADKLITSTDGEDEFRKIRGKCYDPGSCSGFVGFTCGLGACRQ